MCFNSFSKHPATYHTYLGTALGTMKEALQDYWILYY